MKAPDPCERWMLRPAEEIIERLLSRSSAPKAKRPQKSSAPAAQPPISTHRARVEKLFRRDPEIRRKADSKAIARREAALKAAANDPTMKAVRRS